MPLSHSKQPIDYKACLPANFNVTTLSRGDDYFQLKKVVRFNVSEDGLFLDGMVQGSSLRKTYFVEVTIRPRKALSSQAEVESNCTCETQFQCKHAVAIMLAAAAKNKVTHSSPSIEFETRSTLHPILTDDDIDWFAEASNHSRQYFTFKTGIVVDNQQINLLPLITDILHKNTPAEIASKNDAEVVMFALPDGRRINLSYKRLKPMLLNLLELYTNNLESDGSLLMAKHQAVLINELHKAYQALRMRWYGTEKIVELGQQLRDFKAIEDSVVPNGFATTLRPYQQEGVNWLQFLRQYQLGGILADDMGLGKTVQTLAHLAIEHKAGRLKEPVVIIAPTSLMTNWRLEIERFTPDFNVVVFHGDDRHRHLSKLKSADIILTTYPLVVRDQRYLLDLQFSWLILDEAQAIKNHRAKSTLIISQLHAEHRLCLTGTPMENHLGELWSLFNFLVPGFLGDVKSFRRQFKNPIEKLQDHERQQALAARVKPFLLRRLKSEVVKDLPEKTVMVQTVTMDGAQRDLYESIRVAMDDKVRDAVARNGLARSHILILDALLKLRQTVCDPRLLKLSAAESAYGHSAKISVLREMLPNMIEEGRRVLLFSQFTSMLSLIEPELDKLGITYAKLTGRTKNRASAIESFQSGKVPLFLISLKAGGIGLNLTAADTVIHYDPWWNPAAEDQATDRAHRIGQDKSVFVYKLITEGTVEETIMDMQASKRQLLDKVVTSDVEGGVGLTLDDLQVLFAKAE